MKLHVSKHRASSDDGDTGEIKNTHVRRWDILADDGEVREAAARDGLEEIEEDMASAGNVSGDDGEQSSDEGGKLYSVPSPVILSSPFADIETIGRIAGVADASMHLRKAKRALLHAHDAEKRTKVRQSIVTDFFM